jgi:hypothetical protein
VQKVGSQKYSLTTGLSDFAVSNTMTDLEMLARSEFLKSLGVDPYKDVTPPFVRSYIAPSCI